VLPVAAGSLDAEGKRTPPTRNTVRPNTELLSPLQMNAVMVVVGRRGSDSWSTGQYATLPTFVQY